MCSAVGMAHRRRTCLARGVLGRTWAQWLEGKASACVAVLSRVRAWAWVVVLGVRALQLVGFLRSVVLDRGRIGTGAGSTPLSS